MQLEGGTGPVARDDARRFPARDAAARRGRSRSGPRRSDDRRPRRCRTRAAETCDAGVLVSTAGFKRHRGSNHPLYDSRINRDNFYRLRTGSISALDGAPNGVKPVVIKISDRPAIARNRPPLSEAFSSQPARDRHEGYFLIPEWNSTFSAFAGAHEITMRDCDSLKRTVAALVCSSHGSSGVVRR